jgi:hypothetical protein
MKVIISGFVLVLAVIGTSTTALAQRETDKGIEVEKDLVLLRRDLRTEKKKIIAMSLPLTEGEATQFWPVYDQYAEDMRKNNDEFYTLVKDYAANQKTLTDAQAVTMLKRWGELQVATAQTRQKYLPMFEKVLPGKKAALFFQIDRRLYALMDLQTASEVPLVLQ